MLLSKATYSNSFIHIIIRWWRRLPWPATFWWQHWLYPWATLYIEKATLKICCLFFLFVFLLKSYTYIALCWRDIVLLRVNGGFAGEHAFVLKEVWAGCFWAVRGSETKQTRSVGRFGTFAARPSSYADSCGTQDTQNRFAMNSFRFYLRIIDVVESSAAVQQLRVLVPSSGGVAVTHPPWVTGAYVHIGCVSGEITVNCTILGARSYFSVKERCSGCGEVHMSRWPLTPLGAFWEMMSAGSLFYPEAMDWFLTHTRPLLKILKNLKIVDLLLHMITCRIYYFFFFSAVVQPFAFNELPIALQRHLLAENIQAFQRFRDLLKTNSQHWNW